SDGAAQEEVTSIPNPKPNAGCFGHWDLVFWHCFGFRHSDFGFPARGVGPMTPRGRIAFRSALLTFGAAALLAAGASQAGDRPGAETPPPGRWLLMDLRGGYTWPTPAADGERVYALFGSAVLAALDFQGKLLWHKAITPHFFDVALGTSPVLHNGTVLVVCDE